MDKLYAWLHVEPEGFSLWKFFLDCLFWLFIYTSIVGIFLTHSSTELPSSKALEGFVQDHPVRLFVALPFLAAAEELLFRLPLIVFIKRNSSVGVLAAATITLSIIFGLGHGGWIGVPMQGVMGLIFCCVFLKCGGLHKKYGKAFLSSTVVHFSYNFISFGLFLLFKT
ncbi:MAG TPA: CPBP family intramembrane glutamic endopeptidase [Candidatus Paceibacterota bacterium]|nr:CPBP family intramembrane glutamic endopeptidase [Candidatus Paceibacterota bacterium]